MGCNYATIEVYAKMLKVVESRRRGGGLEGTTHVDALLGDMEKLIHKTRIDMTKETITSH